MYNQEPNIEQRICNLLQWEKEQYAEMVFENGLQYLKGLAPDYPQVVSQISRNEIFWNWWRSHWYRRDEQFLEECETWETSLDKYRRVYINHNDPQMLLRNVYLNSQVLHDSYAELFQHITKHQNQLA